MNGGMKALVKTQAGPGLELMDVPMPEVGPNDVLIKIHKTAICGTDLHIWNWDKWAQQTIPVGMHVGHESKARRISACRTTWPSIQPSWAMSSAA